MKALAAADQRTPLQGQAPAGALDPPYDQLAALPRGLWLPVLVSPSGTREQRLRDAQAWMLALQGGSLPAAAHDFGHERLGAALRALVAELGLPAMARGVPSLAEQLLRSLLWHLGRLPDLQPRLSPAEAEQQTLADFRQAWELATTGLQDDWALLRQLADGAELHWDALPGRLRPREWAAAQRAAARVEQLPQLATLLQRLGRRELDPQARPRPAALPAASRSELPLRPVKTSVPGAPGELTGIRSGTRLDSMLPAEAALLRHPMGRRLWRARHAEGRLLGLDSRAELVDWRPDPDARNGSGSDPQPAPWARGPFLLCLDTSGSMRGAPENIAKAAALAALRLARLEGRGCRLISFGGPGEVLERDLGGPGGLQALLDLMGQSFDGGTDIQGPIEHAIERVHQAGWQGADLLIVSDGEFGCVPATLERLDAARRALGLAVHGLLVGDRETMGLLEVCDELHWVHDWRRHAQDDARPGAGAPGFETPVHSKSLTALYFPNALSARAARHRLPQPGQAP